jgi:hypothetical protein
MLVVDTEAPSKKEELLSKRNYSLELPRKELLRQTIEGLPGSLYLGLKPTHTLDPAWHKSWSFVRI